MKSANEGGAGSGACGAWAAGGAWAIGRADAYTGSAGTVQFQRSAQAQRPLDARGNRLSTSRFLSWRRLRQRRIGTLAVPAHRGTDNKLNVLRRPEGHQRVVSAVKYLYRKPFLLFPIGFLMAGRTELTVGKLPIQRKLAVAIQTPCVIRP